MPSIWLDPSKQNLNDSVLKGRGNAYCGNCGKVVHADKAVYGTRGMEPADHFCPDCAKKLGVDDIGDVTKQGAKQGKATSCKGGSRG